MSQVDADTSLVVIDVYALIFGLGLGFNMQTLVLAIQNAVPPQDMGVATVVGDVLPADGRHARAPRCSCRCCSAACRTRSPRRSRPSPRPRRSSPPSRTRPCCPTRRTSRVLDALAPKGGAASASGIEALNDSSFINHLDPRLARPFLVGFADSIDAGVPARRDRARGRLRRRVVPARGEAAHPVRHPGPAVPGGAAAAAALGESATGKAFASGGEEYGREGPPAEGGEPVGTPGGHGRSSGQ